MNLLKRVLPYLWNTMVVLVMLCAAAVILPKAQGQFTYPSASPAMVAIGYVGIGALSGVLLCALSVMSFFWFRVPVWFRLFTAFVIIALAIGYFPVSNLYASSPDGFGSAVTRTDLLIFFGTLATFTFPILVTGYGYPGLIQCVWRKSRT